MYTAQLLEPETNNIRKTARQLLEVCPKSQQPYDGFDFKKSSFDCVVERVKVMLE